MTLPNFLVIGVGRSGTTSFHRQLRAHPEVYVPAVKAPSFFFCHGQPPSDDPSIRLVTRNHFVPDFEDYEALFDGVQGETAVGEVSPVYLATVRAAPRIAKRLPDVRLVAILRHPVDRAWARFVARTRDGLERRSFAEVVRDERSASLIRDEAHGTYLASGFVSHFLETYLSRFDRSRIQIHLFEDLKTSPNRVFRQLFEFLEVDPAFPVEARRRHNRSGGLISSGPLRFLWTRSALLRARMRPYVPAGLRDRVFSLATRGLESIEPDPELRTELNSLFREEIERLQALLGRDLSFWLDPPAPESPGGTQHDSSEGHSI